MALHLPRKVIPIKAIKLSLDDIRTIDQRLMIQIGEQAEFEISRLIRPPNQSEADFNAYKQNAREQAFKITFTVLGRNGQSLFGDDIAVFNSPLRPENIANIYMTNVTAYQAFSGNKPLNAFELTLDFAKPPLLDANNPVSAPTPNFSSLTVQGDRESWIASVCDAVLGVTQARKTKRTWMHQGFVYDAGLFMFALPFALYVCWKVSPFVSAQLAPAHSFLAAVAYVYVTLTTLFAYRILFGYTKWAFPTVELTDNGDMATKHRAILGTIILALVVNIVWEIRGLFLS
jgi:hypothetical protein